MKFFFGKTASDSDKTSTRYLQINNCGGFENITNSNLSREHGRSDYQLIYIKSGIMHFKTSENIVSLGEGTVFLFRPREMQCYSSGNVETTFFWIHFTGTESERMLAFFKKSYYNVGIFQEFESFCRSFHNDYKIRERFNELYYEGYLITIFGMLERKIASNTVKSKKYNRIRKAVDYIEENYHTKPDNSFLSKLCYMSKYYFIKTFTTEVGVTPQKYCTMIIIDKSKHLLDNTDMKIGDIAKAVGIDDVLYFSKLFKKTTGISPSEYRSRE